jgi:trigger factor
VEVPEVMVEIGGASTMQEFSANLRGAAPGDERNFDVSYPEDFADNRLAGKTMSYAVRVKAVKQKLLPDLNDEFAKKLGEFENLEALRARVRESMEHERKHAAEREAKDKIVEQLVSRHEFPVPDSLVEHQIDIRLERGLRALAAQGMRQEDMRRMDFPRLREAQRDQARREVKASLILEKIADQEKIEVSDDELEREVEAVARQSQQPAEAIRARLAKEGALERIRHRIRSEKTLEYLYSRSA